MGVRQSTAGTRHPVQSKGSKEFWSGKMGNGRPPRSDQITGQEQTWKGRKSSKSRQLSAPSLVHQMRVGGTAGARREELTNYAREVLRWGPDIGAAAAAAFPIFFFV